MCRQRRTIPLLRTIGFKIPITLQRSGSRGNITYKGPKVNLTGVPFSSVVQIGETSSNGMGEGADQRNRADRDSVKTPLVDPAQEESGTGTPEPTGLSMPAPPQVWTGSRHWMDKNERAVYHETEETPLLPLRWNGEKPVAQNGAAIHADIQTQNQAIWEESKFKINTIPHRPALIGHIFRKAEGHIVDTPQNRKLLEDVANRAENFLGVDKYGNQWYAQIQMDGSQVWVEARNGCIFEGGINKRERPWNAKTGLKRQG